MGYVVAMGQPMATSQDFVNWVCSGELHWRFLMYVLLAEKDSYRRFAHGTTHQTIYFPEVKAFHICLPSVEEQRRIAGVLGALDNKVEHNQHRAETLDAMSQGLFVAASHGEAVVRVRDVAAINARSHSARLHPREIDYVDISSVAPRKLLETQALSYEDAPSRARRVVETGDTLVSTVRPERRAMLFVARASGALTASTGFAVVSPRDVAPTFLYRAITSDPCIDHLAAAASGSAYPSVDPKVLAEWKFEMPPDHGAAYEHVARPLEDLRWQSFLESRRLGDIRDALLPKLISGAIRVPDSYDPDDALGTVAEAAGVAVP